MKAFVEILSGIIRAGPDTDGYGKPYELSVAFSSIDGKTAVLKALVSDKRLSYSHLRAAVKALKKMNIDVTWERIDTNHP